MKTTRRSKNIRTPKGSPTVAKDSSGTTPEDGPSGNLNEEYVRTLPSALEIAHLAAIIGQGPLQQNLKVSEKGLVDDPINPERCTPSLHTLVTVALELWATSFWLRAEHLERLARRRERQLEPVSADKPKKFPVSLEELLRRAMPGASVADRFKAFRAYRRDCLEHWEQRDAYQKGRPAQTVSLGDVESEFQKFRRDGFSEEHYSSLLGGFVDFLGRERALRAKAAALARWKKSKGHS